MRASASSLLAFLALAACTHSSATPVHGPDGKTWLSIRCGGDQENCYNLAGEECPTGYDVASEGGHIAGSVGELQAHPSTGGTAFSSHEITVYQGNMLIRCHGLGGMDGVTKSGDDCAPEMRPNAVMFWPPVGCKNPGSYMNVGGSK